MADFKPFKGVHYHFGQIHFEDVVAPPYDVISPAEQESLYKKSPFNCVRLILNRIETTDNEWENRYTRAKKLFESWRAQEVLIQDKEAGYYVYQQIFQDPLKGTERIRTALLGILRLEPFDKEVVIPHEKTLSKPKQDRRKLLETTHTNFSPVFGLYEDSESVIKQSLKHVTREKPFFDILDDRGVRHALWPIRHAELQEDIERTLKDKKIYIADGHHRYQTSLDHSWEMRQKLHAEPNAVLPSDFTLMALVEFHDPGLVLFPTHRLIQTFEFSPVLAKDTSSAALLKSLQEDFDIEESLMDRFEQTVQKETHPLSLGLLHDGKAFLLKLKDLEASKKKMLAGKPEIWYELDVNLVTHLIVSRLWQIPEGQWENVLGYTHDYPEALAAVKAKKARAALILKAPKVEVLKDMGAVRELMPQKSTYFYPKLASGTVFYHHK